MMLRAIIVDDEEMVRHGLRYHYHWSKYDIEIAGDFSDGKSALDYLSDHPVELMITDVVMPRLNGLELAQRARALLPELKIIFISGYADVNYLGDALRMNAVDYIFKSIDFDALDAAIERVADIVQRRNTEKRHQRWLEEQLQHNLEVLRQQRLASLLDETDESEEAIALACKTLSIPLDSRRRYVVMVVQVTNRWNLMGGASAGKQDIMQDIALQGSLQACLSRRGGGVLFKKRAYEYICVIDTDEEYEELLLTLSAEIQVELKHQYGAELEIGISQQIQGLRNISQAYRNACDAIYKRYLLDASMPEIAINKYPGETDVLNLRDRLRAEVCASIVSGDREEIRRTTVRSVNSIMTLPTAEEQQNMMIYLLLLPHKLLRDIRAPERGCYYSHKKLLEQFFALKEVYEQREFIVDAFIGAAEAIGRNGASQNNFIIKRVTGYIDAHYMDALSIESLADAVYLTPTYLCVLFKKHTGKTVNSYLTEVRLEKAKELLRQDNLHLQDICYKVGYLSPSYFSRLFRKYYGQTPSEYRESQAERD